VSDEAEPVRLDLESERLCDDVQRIIAEEIQARLDLQDRDIQDPEWVARVALLAADRLLDEFQVRERGQDTPRYRWAQPPPT
jgi:hypothetical protein